jgi:hypothetical protein
VAGARKKEPWQHDWATPTGRAVLRSEVLLPGIERSLAEGRLDGSRGKRYRNRFAAIVVRALDCRLPEAERLRWEALVDGLIEAAKRPGEALETKRRSRA